MGGQTSYRLVGGAKRRTFGKDGKTTGTQSEYGTVDANPDGRYPSNIIGEVNEAHQKYFYAPQPLEKKRVRTIIIQPSNLLR